jgi:hypothetical protein
MRFSTSRGAEIPAGQYQAGSMGICIHDLPHYRAELGDRGSVLNVSSAAI